MKENKFVNCIHFSHVGLRYTCTSPHVRITNNVVLKLCLFVRYNDVYWQKCARSSTVHSHDDNVGRKDTSHNWSETMFPHRKTRHWRWAIIWRVYLGFSNCILGWATPKCLFIDPGALHLHFVTLHFGPNLLVAYISTLYECNFLHLPLTHNVVA